MPRMSSSWSVCEGSKIPFVKGNIRIPQRGRNRALGGCSFIPDISHITKTSKPSNETLFSICEITNHRIKALAIKSHSRILNSKTSHVSSRVKASTQISSRFHLVTDLTSTIDRSDKWNRTENLITIQTNNPSLSAIKISEAEDQRKRLIDGEKMILQMQFEVEEIP